MLCKCVFCKSLPWYFIAPSPRASPSKGRYSSTHLVSNSAIDLFRLFPKHVTDGHIALIFPQWDMVTVILCVILLTYMYGEGKSNYFKGSILILSYLVVIIGFYFSGYSDEERMGVNPHDTLAVGGFVDHQFQSMSFKTIGQTKSGRAY